MGDAANTMSVAADTFGMFESVVMAFVVLISLYFNSVMKQKDEKIAALEKNLEDFKKASEKNLERFKETSRSDDKEVKKDVMGEIFDRRNDVIKLHERVKQCEDTNGDLKYKVGHLEGLHKVHIKT